jgi:hypothetical protein
LSSRGKEFSIKLPEEFKKYLDKDAEERGIATEKVTVWTSTLKRTIQTAEHLTYSKQIW